MSAIQCTIFSPTSKKLLCGIVSTTILAVVIISSAPAKAATSFVTLNIWRTQLTPGDTTLVWSQTGVLPVATAGAFIPGTFTVIGANSASYPLTQSQSQSCIYDDDQFSSYLTVPKIISPGKYILAMNGTTTNVSVIIETATTMPTVVTIPPSGTDDSSAIQAAFNAGQSVNLASGTYQLAHTIWVNKSGLSIIGVPGQTTIHRQSNTADYSNTIFGSTAQLRGFTISGIKFDDYDAPGALLFWNEGSYKPLVSWCDNLEVKRCTVYRGGGIVAFTPGGLIEDCNFEESGLTILPALYRRCLFEGLCRFGNETIVTGEKTVMLDCEWHNTLRGPVLRQGPSNSLFSGLLFDGVGGQVTNGSEVILAEDQYGPGLSSCLFRELRYRECIGAAIELWYTPVRNVSFKYLDIEGGGGIWFAPGTASQTGITIANAELRRCTGVDLGNTSGNVLNNVVVVAPNNTMSNQSAPQPGYYPNKNKAFRNIGRNSMINCKLIDADSNWTQQ